jgi:hypothetical protein
MFLLTCAIVAVAQNYIFKDGTFSFFGIHLTQFYSHVELRILPLLWVSFYLMPTIKNIFKVKEELYLSEFLVTLLVAVDAFTHINGVYSYSVTLFSSYTLWFDKIMHFSEGVVLLLALYPVMMRFLSKQFRGESMSQFGYWLTSAFISIFFILWEIIELVVDRSQGTSLVTSTYDTNEDLAVAYIGLFLGVLIMEVYKFSYKYMEDNDFSFNYLMNK